MIGGPMLSRKLLFVSLVFFVLALGSLALSRSPKVARQIVTTMLQAEALAPQMSGPSPTAVSPAQAPTRAPVKATRTPRKSPTPTMEPLPQPGAPEPTQASAPQPGEPAPTEASAPQPTAPEPTQASSPVPPAPTPQVTTVVEAEWPEKMEFGRSDAIRVSLVRTENGDWVPTVEGAGHTARSATIVPVGTPEAPLQQAFGSKYEGCAVANLVGAAFDVKAINAECQSLDMPRVTWEWNLVAKTDGPQVINVNIEAVWTPVGGEGKVIQRQIWRAQLAIRVTKPLVARGQLQIFSILEGLVGSVFSVPWLHERWKELKEKRKRGKAPHEVPPDPK